MPDNGACDWGLPDADVCTYCQQYYDPRNAYGGDSNDESKCVWVPDKGKCYPKRYTIENLKLCFDEDCTGTLLCSI